MKTGIELIHQERSEQLSKHNRTVEMDIRQNKYKQLSIGASKLLFKDQQIDIYEEFKNGLPPFGWDEDIWRRMYGKSYKERLTIAGALIAAELDRIQSI
jgi:hypothetical protein